MLIIFSEDHILQTLLCLAQERFTAKQKLILRILNYKLGKQPVTQRVDLLAEELDCSKSAIWLNLHQLKRCQLVTYSSQKNKGKPIMLTPLGKWLARKIDDGGRER